MNPTLLTILAASFLGSAHCAGMCGAFAAIATNQTSVRTQLTINRKRPLRATLLHTLYHAGRLLTYASLGAAAGAAGSALNVGGTILGFQRAASVLAGTTLIVIALVMLARRMNWLKPSQRKNTPQTTNRLSPTRALITLQSKLQHKPDHTRAFLTGITTVLLPCAWLYTFVVIAAGTASWWQGALSMTAFWIGTIPALSAFSLLFTFLSAPLQRRMPIIASLFFLTCGVLTILGRIALPTCTAQHTSHNTLATNNAHNTPGIIPVCNDQAESEGSVRSAN